MDSPIHSSPLQKPIPNPPPENIPSDPPEKTTVNTPSPPNRSHRELQLALSPSPISNLSHREEQVALSPIAIVNRSNREETPAVTKMEGLDRRFKVGSAIHRRSKREAIVGKVALGFRVCGLLFCLVSFSVMAADKNRGWAGDSFYIYKAYRYCISATVIGFVYSGFQAYGMAHHFITGEHLIPIPIRYYFDFSMDQILSYLLISASSSAATRTEEWVSNWGEDEFTKMAIASVGMSFLAFISFALSSLVSGYHLCNLNF
ncbi:CASP-like protein 4A3 [Tasmannia lanceolata]|uniref:CASP-like protein 4A3 n=1 Tax=Tasmannia lanceolata TaxID=3420 RepID=UPI004062F5BC